MSDSRRAYRVVDDFESEICAFTGAPFCVAVNSCTNAIQLSLTWERLRGVEGPIQLPRRTYLGVLQAVLRSGYEVEWIRADWTWTFRYDLLPTKVVDSARCLISDSYDDGHLVCLSAHSAKQLALGRGGAILTDDGEADEWFRAARMDGRYPGDTKPPIIGDTLHCPMPPDVAARGLDILSRWEGSPADLPHTNYPDLSEWYP